MKNNVRPPDPLLCWQGCELWKQMQIIIDQVTTYVCNLSVKFKAERMGCFSKVRKAKHTNGYKIYGKHFFM